MAKKRIVVLTGAGVSAESGIKTFRDADGLWENYRIENVATPESWQKNPELVLEFYNQRRRQVKEVLPNQAHFGLKDLEQKFDIKIITKNEDDLNEREVFTDVFHFRSKNKTPKLKQ